MQPTQEGRGQKRKKKLAEEIIVRAKTDTREEKRSNEGLSKKKKSGQACCWQLFLSFFIPECFLAFFSWVHPQSMSATISELFYSASSTGWNHSRFACRLNHTVCAPTLYLHPSPFLFPCHSFSRVATKCDYRY